MNEAAYSQLDRHDPDYLNVRHSIEWVAANSDEPDDCDSCGRPVPSGTGTVVNVEPANYGMNSPYPGYEGDLMCEDCR